VFSNYILIQLSSIGYTVEQPAKRRKLDFARESSRSKWKYVFEFARYPVTNEVLPE
jgi:hypothetical protein